jgi:hypothetical protein
LLVVLVGGSQWIIKQREDKRKHFNLPTCVVHVLLDENTTFDRLHCDSGDDTIEIMDFAVEVAILDNRIEANHRRDEIVKHLCSLNLFHSGLP